MNIKKMMIVGLTLVAGLSLAACSSEQSSQNELEKIKEKGTIVVATSPDYAPFEFQTLVDGKNKIVGADILLAKKFADELGVKLEVSPMNFDNVLNSVQSGKADIAIAGLSYSEDRAKVFDFTNVYNSADNVLLVKSDTVNDYAKNADLASKKLAVQKGTIQEVYANENLTDSSVISLTVLGEAINELKNGKVDAILLDAAVAEGYAAQNPDLAVSTMTFEEAQNDGKVVAMPKDSPELKEALDKIIKEVVDAGAYDSYLEEVSKYTVVE
ncbi:transporter substrate-binding domain-containing protein [Streptococcus sp. X13SY08]|uniref:transporter substrate-binding domain-containing protein n=1 Tax=Streptococcus sp. X13SY08 TaxID=1676616 RepID=UPI00066FCEF4